MTEPTTNPKGRPPNREQLTEILGDRLEWWNAIRETIMTMGATWKWAYSEPTATWSYRSYQEGDRFFVALTPAPGGFEVSLNLKAEEWPAITAENPHEGELLARLKAEALASGQDPAWLHVPVTGPDALTLLTKIFVVRARRVQKPRLKAKKKR
jgi:hypothetical protein